MSSNTCPPPQETGVVPDSLVAHFTVPQLARDLLSWGLQNSDMDPSIANWPGFRTLGNDNKATDEVVVLLVVHQYAYGAIGSLPKHTDSSIKNLRPHKMSAYSRAQEMINYLTKTERDRFLGTPLQATPSFLRNTNLYSKIDNLKKRQKMVYTTQLHQTVTAQNSARECTGNTSKN